MSILNIPVPLVDWRIIYAVEIVVFFLTLLLNFYILFTTYRYLKENRIFHIHILLLYPSFWQVLAGILGLVYYAKSWRDVWFILNVFFEILGTAFTWVYLNRTLKVMMNNIGLSYSLFNYGLYFVALAGVVLCLVGLIQIRWTFIYYKAGVTVLTGTFVIFQIITTFKFFTSSFRKFFGLLFMANAFLIANGVYFMYLGFEGLMSFQQANYIMFVVMDFVSKFVILGISQFLIAEVVSVPGKD